jgi:TolA-binding protein
MMSPLATHPIRWLKRFFFGLSARERFLMVFFVAVLLVIGYVNTARAYGDLLAELQTTRGELETQELWLEQRAATQERLSATLERLDPAQTYSATELTQRLEQMANEIARQNYNLGQARTQLEQEFRIHSAQIRFSQVSIAALIEFDARIQELAPYIGLEQVDVRSTPRRENLLNATYLVTSFELEDEDFR